MTRSESISIFLWNALLVFLPVSSFTLLSKIFGGTSVAPLALIPLAAILFFWWLPVFLKNGLKIAYQVKPLVIFFLFGIISTLLSTFHPVPTFRDIPWIRNSAEVLVTFSMGLGFYLVTIFMVKDAEKLRSALLWKSIGGIALMAVSWIQLASGWSLKIILNGCISFRQLFLPMECSIQPVLQVWHTNHPGCSRVEYDLHSYMVWTEP
jgi:hypothetical protein